MTNLYQGAEDYLELRRSFGFKLKRPCRFIREFVSWLRDRGETRTKRLGDCRCRQNRLTVNRHSPWRASKAFSTGGSRASPFWMRSRKECGQCIASTSLNVRLPLRGRGPVGQDASGNCTPR